MKYFLMIISALIMLAGCSANGNNAETLNESEYREIFDEYYEAVQYHSKMLESFITDPQNMKDGNFQSLEDLLTSQKALLTLNSSPKKYEEVTELWLLSIDEYLEYVDSYSFDKHLEELDMDSFSEGADYLIKARKAMEETYK